MTGSTGLTQQAVSKHEAMITYGHGSKKQKSEAENELAIAKDFENMSMKSGDEGSESRYTASTKSGTYKTFATDITQCTNVTYSK